MRAALILENGRVFEGESIGSGEQRVCEMVFNTSMAGYQEILTDPSYAGQGITMTYPLIGNYGVNSFDNESIRPWPEAFVIRRLSERGSNFRCENDLGSYLEKHNITGIEGIDTRALTRILRNQGTMNGMITCERNFNVRDKLEEIKSYRVTNPVDAVTRKQREDFGGPGYRVALMDFGVKNNMIKSLTKRGCAVSALPARTTAEEILTGGYDGVMLSNGPGDPKDCTGIIEEIKKLYDAKIPMFAVCLGHQLLALANGGDTEKLKYGHRGANHPVRDNKTGRVHITSQNHGYVVTADSLDESVATVSHVNVNDNTVEGLNYASGKAFTVQFHPEASPGPMENEYLFDRFIGLMGGKNNA